VKLQLWRTTSPPPLNGCKRNSSAPLVMPQSPSVFFPESETVSETVPPSAEPSESGGVDRRLAGGWDTCGTEGDRKL
jgi:hypothetical protein